MDRPLGVTLFGIVGVVVGGLSILLGVGSFFISTFAFTLMAVEAILVGALSIFISFRFMQGRSWTRALVLVLGVLAMVGSIPLVTAPLLATVSLFIIGYSLGIGPVLFCGFPLLLVDTIEAGTFGGIYLPSELIFLLFIGIPILYSVFNLLLIYYLTRPKVKAFFAEKEPVQAPNKDTPRRESVGPKPVPARILPHLFSLVDKP